MIIGISLLGAALVLVVAVAVLLASPTGPTVGRTVTSTTGGAAMSSSCHAPRAGTYLLAMRFAHLTTRTTLWSGRASVALDVSTSTPSQFVESYCVHWVGRFRTYTTEHTICSSSPVEFSTSGQLSGVFEGSAQEVRLAGKSGVPAAKGPSAKGSCTPVVPGTSTQTRTAPAFSAGPYRSPDIHFVDFHVYLNDVQRQEFRDPRGGTWTVTVTRAPTSKTTHPVAVVKTYHVALQFEYRESGTTWSGRSAMTLAVTPEQTSVTATGSTTWSATKVADRCTYTTYRTKASANEWNGTFTSQTGTAHIDLSRRWPTTTTTLPIGTALRNRRAAATLACTRSPIILVPPPPVTFGTPGDIELYGKQPQSFVPPPGYSGSLTVTVTAAT